MRMESGTEIIPYVHRVIRNIADYDVCILHAGARVETNSYPANRCSTDLNQQIVQSVSLPLQGYIVDRLSVVIITIIPTFSIAPKDKKRAQTKYSEQPE
jgi:hypothetical protein